MSPVCVELYNIAVHIAVHCFVQDANLDQFCVPAILSMCKELSQFFACLPHLADVIALVGFPLLFVLGLDRLGASSRPWSITSRDAAWLLPPTLTKRSSELLLVSSSVECVLRMKIMTWP